MDFFSAGLALSLTLAGLGLAWKMLGWLRIHIAKAPTPTFASRFGAALRAGLSCLSPLRLARLLKGLVLDAVVQRRIAGNGLLRWVMHTAILVGFTGLTVMHALDEIISARWFPEYASTMDPYQMLRNLFGTLVLAGLVIATGRRVFLARVRRLTGWRDVAFLALIWGIIGSGFFLEATKIISPSVFDSMVEEYLGSDDEAEINGLKLLWANEYGVVFSPPPSGGEEALELGREANEDSCVYCHSPMASAFVSFPLASALPAPTALNAARADISLYYVHVGLCFLGLALLPWGKFFHPLSTPLNLALRGGVRTSATGSLPPALAENRRGVGIDACTHCGACSDVCSVAPSFSALGNANILPSEKLISLGLHARSGRAKHARSDLESPALRALAEGSHICTECLRCTLACPSGIDLQDLWITSKAELDARGHGGPHALMATKPARQWAETFRALPPAALETDRAVNLADRAESFWGCIQCTTCTSVCPVVALSDAPTRDLDLTPQQIMNMLRMGLKEEALGANMVWSCVTCYKCQENCPQGVRVADVLYELRNLACARLRQAGQDGPQPGPTTQQPGPKHPEEVES